MSSEQAMRGILQTRLLTLGWAEWTAFEGKGFADGREPNGTIPYQEVETRFASAVPIGLARTDMLGGTFQVRLMWPVAQVRASGIGAPNARAEAIKALFPRTWKQKTGGQTVKITRAPAITRGPPQGDRDVTIVRVRFADR
ncbi:MAG: phage tail terminator-like protein [Phenylobacterium sp.]|uniref:phage tail terminator-like protein n=1 Tax=Phenylobacterium sp. TaxID=1871053 RepID=UPI0027208741|nr:phage tail terminator-like protein [Phenylobacterium sp.]MDO8912300.1 phage tail terminator-like protein [Phenylobacterium sp.]MDP3099512.1 phage tail terminator-like protein [Phenylobacterium sp.]